MYQSLKHPGPEEIFKKCRKPGSRSLFKPLSKLSTDHPILQEAEEVGLVSDLQPRKRIPARRRGTLLPPICRAAGTGPRETPSSDRMNSLMGQSAYFCHSCSLSSVYPSDFLLSCSSSCSSALPGPLYLLPQSNVSLDALPSP